jgi:membrane protein implicated in regulation of membrane protease activity
MIGAFKVVFWHWWTLAGLLLIFEMTLPGVAFLFMAMGAAVVGLVLLVAPGLSLELQLLIFAVAGVVAAVVMRKLLPERLTTRKAAELNDRGAQLVGTELTLSEPIVNGRARVKIGDSSWTVTGPDMAAGFKVRVVAVEGAHLKIEPVR